MVELTAAVEVLNAVLCECSQIKEEDYENPYHHVSRYSHHNQ